MSSSSKLVTYDAICAAIKGRGMLRWFFKDNLGTLCHWDDVNQNAMNGTLMLMGRINWDYPDVQAVADSLEIYLVRWTDDQFTLERIF